MEADLPGQTDNIADSFQDFVKNLQIQTEVNVVTVLNVMTNGRLVNIQA